MTTLICKITSSRENYLLGASWMSIVLQLLLLIMVMECVVCRRMHHKKMCYLVVCCFDLRLNTLRPRHNGRHFHIHFLEWKCMIFKKFSLKFVPNVPTNNNPALVQIMAWRRSGDKPLSESMVVSLLTHICVNRPQRVKHNKTRYCPMT